MKWKQKVSTLLTFIWCRQFISQYYLSQVYLNLKTAMVVIEFVFIPSNLPGDKGSLKCHLVPPVQHGGGASIKYFIMFVLSSGKQLYLNIWKIT